MSDPEPKTDGGRNEQLDNLQRAFFILTIAVGVPVGAAEFLQDVGANLNAAADYAVFVAAAAGIMLLLLEFLNGGIK